MNDDQVTRLDGFDANGIIRRHAWFGCRNRSKRSLWHESGDCGGEYATSEELERVWRLCGVVTIKEANEVR